MYRMIHRVAPLVALIASAGCGKPADTATRSVAGSQILVHDVGFAAPASVIHDPITDVYLVSNINGSPTDRDDNGFISLVSPEGNVIALKWIDGDSSSVYLNAPRGMAVYGEFLYVADLTTVRRFDRRTGAPRGETPIPGATLLSDVATTDEGYVYVTDSGLRPGANGLEPSGTDAVYRMGQDGKLETLARGDSLGRPTGVAVTGDSVWVVGFGSGELYRVAGGTRTDVRKLARGELSGLVAVFGEVFVSSWEGETIYRGRPAGPFVELLHQLKTPADIGHDLWRNRLLIPLYNDNALRFVPLAQ